MAGALPPEFWGGRQWYPEERQGEGGDPGLGVGNACGAPRSASRQPALCSSRSNGYINIISPASCPVTRLLTTRRGARAAPAKDVHSVRGPVRAGAGQSLAEPTLRGDQGDIWRVKALGQTPRAQRFSALVLLGARNSSLSRVPYFGGSPGSAPEPGARSQALARGKTLPLAFIQSSTLQTLRSEP